MTATTSSNDTKPCTVCGGLIHTAAECSMAPTCDLCDFNGPVFHHVAGGHFCDECVANAAIASGKRRAA